MWGYKNPLKFLFYLFLFEKNIMHSRPWFFDVPNRKDYIIVYMLLSMTPLCYGPTDSVNLITDGSLWNNYKEKIGQQPQWFHASPPRVFSTILLSPSTLKNNVSYQSDNTVADWEVDLLLYKMILSNVCHSKSTSLQNTSVQPVRLAVGHITTTAKISSNIASQVHSLFSQGHIPYWTMAFQSSRIFPWAYRSELRKWIWLWGSYTCLIAFYGIHFQPQWNSLPSMNSLIKLPRALILMLPHSRENFACLSRDYFNVLHLKLVGTF